MNRVLFFMLFFPLVVTAQNVNDTGFIITGNIKNLSENSIVYFAGNNENDTIAKTTVKQGNFILTGKVSNTDGRMLIFPAANARLFLFIGNERINISASNSSLEDVVVSGSSTQSDYEQFIYQIKPLGDFVNYFRGQTQSAQTQEAKDSAMIMLNTAYNIYQNSIDRFITRRKSSPVSALVLDYSYAIDPNQDAALLEKRFNILSGSAMQNRYANEVKHEIEKARIGAVGTTALDFTQQDTSGKNISLAQFRGKYVLLDFWASWCKPCRMENPNVVAAYNEYKNKNFTILSVSLDQDKNNWLNAIKADHLSWTHVSDLQFWGNEAAKLYHVESIPQNYLIDPNGTIIAKNLRGDELKEKLHEVLK
ncbi:MAG TPA: TlpA disulfide reductase family protein [Chitinophagaceae bacterium]|jgi:peroxiredoxin